MPISNIHNIQKKEVVKRINPYLLDKIPLNNEHQCARYYPSELLCADRFDIIVKYIYASHFENNVAMEWAKKIYQEHLRSFGGFIEGDYSGKNSLEKYIADFETLLKDVKRDGFNPTKTLVPLDRNNVIIDGAHRLSACLYYNRKIDCISFNYDAAVYNYNYFLNKGFPEQSADNVALEYCKINDHSLIAVLFPVAKDKDEEVFKLLESVGEIFYIKKVIFTNIGKQNIIQQLYKGESWLGKNGEVTQGISHHIKKRFVDIKPVKFIIFTSNSGNDILEVKEKIRSLFPLGNDSIHINDTHEETVRIAEQILNENSIHFLNYARPWKSTKFNSLFKEYQKLLSKTNKDNYVIDTGAVIAAYGLRDTDDIDYLHYGAPLAVSLDADINSHNDNDLAYHQSSLGDLIFDPRNFFHFDGCKFLTLKQIKKLKETRNEPKDIQDIALIDTVLNGISKLYLIKSNLFYKNRVIQSNIKEFKMWKLKYLLPKSLHPIASKIYNFPLYVKEQFGPQNRTMQYKEFILHYSKGTSLIYRILRGKTYEPAFTTQMLKRLRTYNDLIFIDVGANIGLISLNILAALPSTKIFAFEPGPHQFELFSKTITSNQLQKHITLYNEALSDKTGVADFAIHNTQNASGDGFVDTGRAGNTNIIKVKCNTLDNWWISVGNPLINAIKIDSEGAELWILRGGRKLIQECNPIIFFEFNKLNNANYPYDMSDILSFFEKIDYEVTTRKGESVLKSKIEQLTEIEDDFIAIPN